MDYENFVVNFRNFLDHNQLINQTEEISHKMSSVWLIGWCDASIYYDVKLVQILSLERNMGILTGIWLTKVAIVIKNWYRDYTKDYGLFETGAIPLRSVRPCKHNQNEKADYQ